MDNKTKKPPRPVTVGAKTSRLTRAEIEEGIRLQDDYWALLARPKTRGECPTDRPCLWVGCRYNLFLDFNPRTGSLKLNFPHLLPHEMTHSCALDLAEREGMVLEEVGEVMNITRERVRQIEDEALTKLRWAAFLGSDKAFQHLMDAWGLERRHDSWDEMNLRS